MTRLCTINLHPNDDDDGWEASLDGRLEGTSVTEVCELTVGHGATPGAALDAAVKWATDRGLYPAVDLVDFSVYRKAA